jgi:fatty acid desaturase
VHDQSPIAEARELVQDLYEPKPLIYWADFLFHIVFGWTAFAVALIPSSPLWVKLVAVLLAVPALYRSVLFTHELAHLKKGTFKVFRVVWNLLCGIPLLAPSFTYRGVHSDHHKRDIYGTGEDGEYVPFAIGAPYEIILYLLLVFILPLFFIGRFLILTPIAYMSRTVRRLTWRRASSLTIDLAYVRPDFAARDETTWWAQEFAALVYSASVVGLVIAGILPVQILLLWYTAVLLVLLLNSFRTLAAHAYRNPVDRRLSLWEQYLDSVNVPGNPLLTSLWAPVGLRYHATHHLFPNMPYHNLGRAHRLLKNELTEADLYLNATRSSLWNALSVLWGEAKANTRAAN